MITGRFRVSWGLRRYDWTGCCRSAETVRNQDTVARYGGDEFVVVLCGLSDDADAAAAETEQVARKLQDVIATPIVIRGNAHHIGASIGAAISRLGEGEPGSLIRKADTAMYRAKRSNAGQIGIFDCASNDSVLLEDGQHRHSARR